MALPQLKKDLDNFVNYDNGGSDSDFDDETASLTPMPSKTAEEIIQFINDYIDAKTKEYKTNVESNRITFGKWKGLTVKEVCASDKGKDYLKWLLKQQWFTEDKNPNLFEDLRACKVLKKI